jgi:hypothetical protein
MASRRIQFGRPPQKNGKKWLTGTPSLDNVSNIQNIVNCFLRDCS